MALTKFLKLNKNVSEHDQSKITTINTEMDELDSSLGGMLTLPVSGSSNVTLTRTQALNAVYRFTGVLTGNIIVYIPVVANLALTPPTTTVGALRCFAVWNATTDTSVAQVETATVVGTITTAGNATVIITAAGMTGSPKTKSVAVALNDTASLVAGKIRTALIEDVDVSALFVTSGSGATVVLTRNTAAANDATLNINIDNGTCAGLTAAPTSANTTAGIAISTLTIRTSAVGSLGLAVRRNNPVDLFHDGLNVLTRSAEWWSTPNV